MSVMAQLPEITDTAEAQTMMSDTVGTTEPLSVLPLAAPISHEWTYDFTWEDLSDCLGTAGLSTMVCSLFRFAVISVGSHGRLAEFGSAGLDGFIAISGLAALVGIGSSATGGV